MLNKTIHAYRDLSDEMQLMIQNTIFNAYDIDSKRGELKSQQSKRFEHFYYRVQSIIIGHDNKNGNIICK